MVDGFEGLPLITTTLAMGEVLSGGRSAALPGAPHCERTGPDPDDDAHTRDVTAARTARRSHGVTARHLPSYTCDAETMSIIITNVRP
ncbi:hypothetical protein GCM10023167_12760 [Brevibacterium pityocampae]|uniref:Uncharacterized protein n=1 Tax=Brevibacterium pityocampae TaxID=506594 RepID=A0ABP8JBF9_9MICO